MKKFNYILIAIILLSQISKLSIYSFRFLINVYHIYKFSYMICISYRSFFCIQNNKTYSLKSNLHKYAYCKLSNSLTERIRLVFRRNDILSLYILLVLYNFFFLQLIFVRGLSLSLILCQIPEIFIYFLNSSPEWIISCIQSNYVYFNLPSHTSVHSFRKVKLFHILNSVPGLLHWIHRSDIAHIWRPV
jgi:hypothetical protein